MTAINGIPATIIPIRTPINRVINVTCCASDADLLLIYMVITIVILNKILTWDYYFSFVLVDLLTVGIVVDKLESYFSVLAPHSLMVKVVLNGHFEKSVVLQMMLKQIYYPKN